MNSKQEAQCCHTIACLVTLLADYTHDLIPNGQLSKDFKQKAQELMPIAEQMLEAAFHIEEVRSSTYINDLSNKIDTIIRHNFKQII